MLFVEVWSCINCFMLVRTYSKEIQASTIVFVNNFAFGPEVDQHLKDIFQDLADGTRIFSSKSFCALNFRITDRNLTGKFDSMILRKNVWQPSCGEWGNIEASRPVMLSIYLLTYMRAIFGWNSAGHVIARISGQRPWNSKTSRDSENLGSDIILSFEYMKRPFK